MNYRITETNKNIIVEFRLTYFGECFDRKKVYLNFNKIKFWKERGYQYYIERDFKTALIDRYNRVQKYFNQADIERRDYIISNIIESVKSYISAKGY